MLVSNVDSSQYSNNEKEPRSKYTVHTYGAGVSTHHIASIIENTAESPQGSVHAAIARTATRGLALFFARPVRLFRPSKGENSYSRSPLNLS